MSKKSGESVTTFADHEVILPPNKLTKAFVRGKAGAAPDDDAIARAEQALATLSTEFSSWMEEECARLDTARRRAKQEGLGGEQFNVLFRAAHDIKGEAATFGYPLIAPVADSLCRLLEYAPDPAQIPFALVDQHVDAVRAILREQAASGDKTAEMLGARLRAVTDEFLVEQNRDRPDYLESILGPPLAPGS